MLLVVSWHVAYYSDIKIFPYSNFFILFRMPLFFFISGFILSKKYIWNLSNSIKFLSKKFLVQIIPSAIFLSIYMFVFSINTIDGARLNGYWFAIALFEYFLIYVLFNLFIKNEIICNTTLLISAIFIYLTCYGSRHLLNPFIYKYVVINLEFFVFFIIGTITKKHFEKVKFIFDNNIIMAFVIAFMLIGSIFFLKGYFARFETRLALSILGIFSTFYFFMKNDNYMDKNRIGKALRFIGRRTLDIYLLHYFFVHNSISWIKNTGIESSTLIFMISIATSLIIIGICLLISNSLRSNVLLGKILFGAKLPAKTDSN